MINTQTNHSIKTMDTGIEVDFSTIRTEAGKILENFIVLHRFKVEIFLRTIQSANHEMVKLTILPCADLTIDRRVVSHLTNKNVHKT